MDQNIKIGFLSEVDLRDITRLSGTSFNIRRVLEEKGFEVICIDRLEDGFHWLIFLKRIKAWLGRTLQGKNYRPWWTRVGARVLAARAMEKIFLQKPDVLLSWSTPILSQLKVDIPKLLYTDATFHLMVDFYGNYTGWSHKALAEGELLANEAMHNADRLLFSSQWAANSAVEDYSVPAEKVNVVTLGANIDVQHEAGQIIQLVKNKNKEQVHLLFMGVDWQRKGGDKAIAIAAQLRDLGFDAILHVVGSTPPPDLTIPSFVRLHGFISKASPVGQERLEMLFSKVHFLVLPTLADCTPMVYAELNAYGIPAITHNVGGIASVVEQGKNGLLFETDTSPREIASVMATYLRDPESYEKLALRSFQTYKEELNWDVTGENLAAHIRSLCQSKIDAC